MNMKVYDLVGIGIGPFNLSLAALLEPKKNLDIKFLDLKKEFNWHPELIFDDAPMQTSFLKDLVTPVDPTNPYSFLNYLATNNQFYQFVNTGRSVITRIEFQDYMKWASHKLEHVLNFDQQVKNIEYSGEHFKIKTHDKEIAARHICVASGPIRNIPECARPHLGKSVFHAKSSEISDVDLQGKRVLIVGGGQTGVETFRNALKSRWGKCSSIKLITGRENLQPLDEGAFTNEIFSPDFVSHFYDVDQDKKDAFTRSLLLASDGNTPSYLQELYNELYLDRYYKKEYSPYEISPMSWLEEVKGIDGSYECSIKNNLNGKKYHYHADIIILATGFCTKLPSFMESLKDNLEFDEYERPIVLKDYRLKSKTGENNIYAMNYSRHGHGIADPQTSLMSWRSSIIARHILNEDMNSSPNNSFLNFFNNEE